MSELFTMTISCSFCADAHKERFHLPEGWRTRYQGGDEETAFCPKHSIIAEFADSQCPGCVGGWGDCDLWSAFAYQKLKLTGDDMKTLERGVCPKRTGGSFMVDANKGELEQVDLRSPAVVKAGQALATAIREYAAKYHKPE